MIAAFGIGLILLVVVAAVMLEFARRETKVPDFLSLPSPNGFALLREAAASLQTPDSNQTAITLSGHLQMNPECLRMMLEASRHPAELPQREYNPTRPLINDLRQIEKLTDAARQHAEQFESESKWPEAAAIHLAIVRAGHQVARGPFVSLHAGARIESAGLQGLERASVHLRMEERFEIARELEALQEARLSMRETQEREAFYWEYVLGGGRHAKAFVALHPAHRGAMADARADRRRVEEALEACRRKLLIRNWSLTARLQ